MPLHLRMPDAAAYAAHAEDPERWTEGDARDPYRLAATMLLILWLGWHRSG